MKKLSVLILLLIAVGLTSINAQIITFKANWKKGDSFNYYLFHNKYNPNNKDYIKNKDTTIIHFKVVSNTKKGIVLEMLHDYSKRAIQPFTAKGLQKIVGDIKLTPIKLELDTNGKFIAIKNWREVRLRCQKEIASGKKSAPAQEKGTWDYWKGKLNTEVQLEKFFTTDIEFFFMLFGSKLKRNRTIDYEDQMMSPYGDILPAKTQLITKDDSINTNLTKVQFYTLPDGMKCSDLIKKYREMARGQEDDPDAIPDIALFDLQDYYEFAHNTQTTIHTKSMYMRYVKTGSKKLIEEWQFILAP